MQEVPPATSENATYSEYTENVFKEVSEAVAQENATVREGSGYYQPETTTGNYHQAPNESWYSNTEDNYWSAEGPWSRFMNANQSEGPTMPKKIEQAETRWDRKWEPMEVRIYLIF